MTLSAPSFFIAIVIGFGSLFLILSLICQSLAKDVCIGQQWQEIIERISAARDEPIQQLISIIISYSSRNINIRVSIQIMNSRKKLKQWHFWW